MKTKDKKSTVSNKYKEKIVSYFIDKHKVENKLAVPKVLKVVVNMGIGDLSKNKEAREQVIKDLSLITGQLPSVRKAKVSVASFGIREGAPVGLKVTLRGERMYAFIERLFAVVLPRLRDFRGVSLEAFDKNGNYTLGIEEHTVFPEIDIAKSGARGLEVTFVTSTGEKDKSEELLRLLGVPFVKIEN